MRRLVLLAVTTIVFIGIAAAPASAHVTVSPEQATAGSFARVAFRVPNESDTASTTKLEVHLPQDAPLASVSTTPVPGWTVAVQKRPVNPPVENHGVQVTEAVSVITWTANDGVGIKPGEFLEFPVAMGPLPSVVNQLVFKALQTYSDGAVVRWIEPPEPGHEPETPAPVLKLVAASPTAAPNAAGDDDGGDSGAVAWVALGVAILALLLTGVALFLAAWGMTRSRRATP